MTVTNSHTQKILFLIRTSPYGNSPVNEALDVIISAATLDQFVGVIFLDDGVWQIKDQQQPQFLQLKSYTLTFNMLSLYGNVKIWVEEESLVDRELNTKDLFMPVTLIKRDEVSQLLLTQKIVFSF